MKRDLVLIFGESDYDTLAIKEFVRPILGQGPLDIRTVRKPIILSSDAATRARLKVMDLVARTEQAERKERRKVIVIAHRDCDAVEPAHEAVTASLIKDMVDAGIERGVAATPAWETEVWLMNFPEAFRAYRSCWRTLTLGNRNLGKIADTKEFLKRELRARPPVVSCKDYREADMPDIARKAAEMGLKTENRLDNVNSLSAFKDRLREAYNA